MIQLLKKLKELYPDYTWAIYGSTALKWYDDTQSMCRNIPQKFHKINPKDIDVVTNARICTGAFKDLLHSIFDVIEIKQENTGKYNIPAIKKRLTVVTTEGTLDFVFADIKNAKEWLSWQHSTATQCLYEVPLDTNAAYTGEIVSKEFEAAYRGKMGIYCDSRLPATEKHIKRAYEIANYLGVKLYTN